MLASLGFALFNVWTLWRGPLGGVFVERAAAEVGAEIEALLLVEASPGKTGPRLAALLAETPRNWPAIDAIMTLAAEQEALHPDQGPNPPAEIALAVAEARDADHGWFQSAGDCAACAWDAKNCNLDASLICNIAPQLSPLGDILGIASESTHFVQGQPVDEITLLLSTLGLGAVAITPLTGGASLSVKAGAGVAKTAYRVGAISAPILAAGRRAARSGIDWSLLTRVRPATFSDDVARAIRPNAIRPAVSFLESAGDLRASTGLTDSLVLLSKVDDVAEARKMSYVAKSLKSRATGAVEMVGKSKLFKLTVRFANEIYWITSSLLAAILAIAGLGVSAGKSILLRRLRHLAR